MDDPVINMVEFYMVWAVAFAVFWTIIRVWRRKRVELSAVQAAENRKWGVPEKEKPKKKEKTSTDLLAEEVLKKVEESMDEKGEKGGEK
jgi:flagellar biosynthesis/type III secretory pathway M-ring protein FliF/YscJ